MANDKNPYVAIAGTIGGISCGLAAIVLIFAKEQGWVLAPAIGSLAIMGIFMGYFASKKR